MTNDTTKYPNAILTCLHEGDAKRRRERLLKVLKEIHEKSSSIDSVYGLHGHSFITQLAAAYTELNDGKPFVEAEEPPLQPFHLPAAAQFEINETNRQYNYNTTAYNKMRLTLLPLRNRLKDAANPIYWTHIVHHHHGKSRLSATSSTT
jgi:hypothetical protein